MTRHRDERTHQRKAPSCWPCRRRKLKCDRSLPACSNCIHRGDITGCRYASSSSTPHRPPASPSPTIDAASTEFTDVAQEKLANLERIVLQLVHNQQAKATSADDRGIDVGALPVDQHWARRSVDDARWDSLVHEIQEVRASLCSQQERYEQQHSEPVSPLLPCSIELGPTLLFDSGRSVERGEILSSLPSKYSCDLMIARFFAHLYPPLYILHEPSFRNQYNKFWEEPDGTSIVWIAILFAIFRIAALDYLREDDEPLQWKGKCQSLAIAYRRRLADCLVLADYLQPHEFLIEALVLHQYAEYVSSKDAKSSVWVLTGMVIRLAMRMGYHQSSQPTLNQSPFKVEMRRRAWAYLRQSDIMLSFQMGLPSMIGLDSMGIALPRNIQDDESFYEGCPELPPALPDWEPTRIAFLIAKTRLVFGFARALAEVNRKPRITCERLLEIDRGLRRIYERVPQYYKLGQMQKQDSLILCSARFSLATIYHKALCITHSRFLGLEAEDSRYAYSTRVCLSSALSILRMQATQDQVLPVDGRLRSLTNYQTSLAVHDYLLAAAILSTHLFSTLRNEDLPIPRSTTATNPFPGLPSRTEMIKAVEGSAKIFSQAQARSSDARKAAHVLGTISKKLSSASGSFGAISKQARAPSRPFSSDGPGNRMTSRNPNLEPVHHSLPLPQDTVRATSFSRDKAQSDLYPRYSSTSLRRPTSAQPPVSSSSAETAVGRIELPTLMPAPMFQPDAEVDCLPLGRRLDDGGNYVETTCNNNGIAQSFALSPIGSKERDRAGEGMRMWDEMQSELFDGGELTDNELSAWFYNESLPPLAVNEPLSTLWNLNNTSGNLYEL